MSKDFERAYKEVAQIECPDLWDRIEAGLKDKSVPEKERKKVLVFKRYSGVLAAAVCVAIILPAAVLLRQNTKGYSAGSAAGGIEEAVEEGAEESAAVTEAEADMAMPMDAGGEDNAAADTGGEDDLAMDAGGQNNAAMDAGASNDSVMSTDAENGVKAENDRETAKTMEDASDEMAVDREMSSEKLQGYESSKSSETAAEEGEMLQHVPVKVVEVKENFYGEGETKAGVLCTASLQQGMPDISEGERIRIYVPSDFQISLTKDEVFEADLECRDEADYSYVLREIYR